MKKVKVCIDVYYYKAALSGIRTYITELKLASEKYGSENIEYIFSHDIDKLSNNQLYLNSENQLIRWLFQLNYLVWKQLILPVKLLWYKPDYLICPDYVAPIFSFKTKKITVIHDSLFWDYPNNYSSIWRKYFISLINLGIDNKTQIITTSNYSKKNLYRKKTYYTLCIEQDVLAKNKDEADTLLSDAGINYSNIGKDLAEEKGGVETHMVDANYTDSAKTEYVAKVVYDDYDGLENAKENGDVELDTYALETDVINDKGEVVEKEKEMDPLGDLEKVVYGTKEESDVDVSNNLEAESQLGK